MIEVRSNEKLVEAIAWEVGSVIMFSISLWIVYTYTSKTHPRSVLVLAVVLAACAATFAVFTVVRCPERWRIIPTIVAIPIVGWALFTCGIGSLF